MHLSYCTLTLTSSSSSSSSSSSTSHCAVLRRRRGETMAGARASSCRLSGTPARRGHRTTRVVPSRPLRRVSLQFSRQSSLHRASNEKGNNGNAECDVSSMSSTNSSITAMMQASVPMTQKKTKKMATISTTVGALSMLTMMYPLDALAKGGELGLLEGRSFALVHPLIVRYHHERMCTTNSLLKGHLLLVACVVRMRER